MKLCGSLTRTRTSTQTGEAVPVEAFSLVRKARDARLRPPCPARSRRRVEANLADLGRRPVDERMQLPSRAERVDDDRRTGREDELAQVDVPPALPRPADVLSGRRRSRRSRRPDRCARTRSARSARCPGGRAGLRTTPGLLRSRTRDASARAARRARAGRRGRRHPRPRGRRRRARDPGRGSRNDPRIGCCWRCGRTGQPRHVSL